MRIVTIALAVMLALADGVSAETAPPDLSGDWQLQTSTVTYHVSHPLKKTQGASQAAKGKGRCDARGTCEWLVGLPAKSFESGNSNRDLHMLEVVKGALHPLIAARLSFDIHAPGAAVARVQLAGEERVLPVHALKFEMKGPDEIEVRLEVGVDLTDFHMERPTLVTVPIEGLVPVDCVSSWRRTSAAAR